MKKSNKVSTIRQIFPDGEKVSDVVKLNDKSWKIQPKKESLKEGEIDYSAHVTNGKGLHVDIYQRKNNRVTKIGTVTPQNITAIPMDNFFRNSVTVNTFGTPILGIKGGPLPKEIYVFRSGGSITVEKFPGSPAVTSGSVYFAEI
ncbi:MAG: hypothetical protein ACTSPL_08115 [Candidatus Odinarchaeia archaeon]